MNSVSDMLWFAWPWVGLGGGIVLLLLLLFSDTLRSDLSKCRWKDPVWLSWMVAFVYLPHVCEEYGMHIENGQFTLTNQFKSMGIDEMVGGIPLAFFPLVNIALTWIALPIAAVLSRKNPVAGLSGMGFILVNGLTHVGPTIVMKMSLIESAGSVTGVLFFLPLFIWICYVAKKDKILPKKGLGIAIASGAAAHVLLFVLYGINRIAGSAVMLLCIPVVAFSSLIIARLLCKMLRIDTSTTVVSQVGTSC